MRYPPGMAESPTLRLQDSQTGIVYSWAKLDPEGWRNSTHTLVDDEGREVRVPDAQIRGDFARYRLVGSDLPVDMTVIRREDDGTETTLTLDRVENEGAFEDEARVPWRARFRSADGEIATLTETEFLQGLQELPAIYRLP